MSPTLHSTPVTDEAATQNRLATAPDDMSDILNPLGLLQPKLARIEAIAMRTVGAVIVIGGLGFLFYSLLSVPS